MTSASSTPTDACSGSTWRAAPWAFDDDGLPTGYQGVILDIDDRKREEERLRRAAEQAVGVLDGMPALPWTEVIDPLTGVSRYTFMGVQSTEMLGYTPEELIEEPRHFERMVHPDDRAASRSR